MTNSDNHSALPQVPGATDNISGAGLILFPLSFWVSRNGKVLKNLNTSAHITALAVAYAAVVTESRHSYRILKHL